jgi:hypothetical protein
MKVKTKCGSNSAITVLFSFISVALLLTLSVPDAHGQVLIGMLLGDKVSTENFHLGVGVGVNLADLNGIDDTSLRRGFMLGIIAEWRFADHFYLQPELLPFYQVGAKDLPEGGLDVSELEQEVTDIQARRELSYMAVPVLLKYGLLEDRLHIGAGPQVGFLSGATDIYEGVIENKITVDDDIEDELSSTDAGATFLLEYKLGDDPFSTGISVRYYLGLVDIVEDNPGDAVYNRVFTISLSVPMGGLPESEEE